MEPFKNLINKGTVEAIGTQLQRAWPAFDRKHFLKLAQTGLDTLEFKARARHVSAALEATLPEDFDHAATLLEGMSEETLNRVIPAFGTQMPIAGMVDFLIAHEAHHKGQIWMMSRMIGLEPPMFVKMG